MISEYESCYLERKVEMKIFQWSVSLCVAAMVTCQLGGAAAQTCTDKAETPAALFQAIRYLAARERYTELQKYVYPLKAQLSDGPLDLQKAIIEGIRVQREYSDFAYSDLAITMLLNQHLDQFKPAPKAFLQDFVKASPELSAIAQKTPEAFFLFTLEKPDPICSPAIFIVKQKGEYKLIFWEDLTCLAPVKN